MAAPTIESVAGPDDQVWTTRGASGICTAYNDFVDKAAATEGCEALVLVHDDVEIHDPRFRRTVLDAVAEPDVGVVGVVGGSGLWGATWWESRRWGGEALYTREVVGSVENRRVDVDVVDGFLMALSPRAVATLRFDPRACPGWHGYDTDLCLQAVRAGLRVVVRPLDTYHRTKATLGDEADFHATKRRLVAKYPDLIHRRRADEWARDTGRRARRRLAAATRRGAAGPQVRRGPGAPVRGPVPGVGAQLAAWVQELRVGGTVLVATDRDDDVVSFLGAAGFDARTGAEEASEADLALVRAHGTDPSPVIVEAARRLVPGGTLAVEWVLGTDDGPAEDRADELASILGRAGLRVDRVSTLCSDIYLSPDARRDRLRTARRDRVAWPSHDLVRVEGSKESS